MPQTRWLELYARRFDTVEVNFSFYRLPTRAAFESWRDRAPPGFCYAVKGSRFITHIKRLREPEEHLDLFADRLEGLGDRAGPVLWQLPPQFRRDDERLERFVKALPRRWRHTVEFRHPTWYAEPVYALLREHGVALTVPDHPKLPQARLLTADWTYVRFHYGRGEGGDYTDAQIDEWAEWLRSTGAEAWVFFNNDWQGFALKNADALKEQLGV